MRSPLLQETATLRAVSVVFRAYDDGVAFRYSLASQDNLADGDTVRERTGSTLRRLVIRSAG